MSDYIFTNMCLAWALVIFTYITRNTFLGFLWRYMKIFFIVLLVTLGANYAKGKVKDWWNK